ncbi:MAG TPA: hypothetical protein VFV38_06695 [Ktedonobacteraceae bacterium]|nr:hypothetical protein [Ktedonobacteraceae bacterium]
MPWGARPSTCSPRLESGAEPVAIPASPDAAAVARLILAIICEQRALRER